MLIVQPKDAAATQFSKERVGPFIKKTPVLRNLIGSSKSRTSGDTVDYKAFPGGFLGIVGAGSPDNLARRPIRIILFDEVDKYLPLKEGNPLDIGAERLATFESNSLDVAVCSPTITGESKIEVRFNSSDQRRASVSCPECGHRQFPPRVRCLRCGGDAALAPVRTTGTIYARTVNRRAPEEAFASLVPYAVALIDLDAGVRVIARADYPADEVRTGDRVEVFADPAPPVHPGLLFRRLAGPT